MLAEAIAGVSIRGSWMAHAEVYRIHRILRGLRRYHLASAPLILGKETILDPALGPAVERLSPARGGPLRGDRAGTRGQALAYRRGGAH